MYARQGELLERFGAVVLDRQRLTESAIELALAAHRSQLILEHQYADHRGIADSASREEIASLPLDDVYVLPRLSSERSSAPARDREREIVHLLAGAGLEDLAPARRRELEEEYAAVSGEHWKAAAVGADAESLASVLAEHRRVVVLGGPGAGKSVLTRFLARTCAMGVDVMERRLGWAEDVTPVVLSLAAFAAERRERSGLVLRAYLDAEMERRGGEPLREAISRELAAGRLLLLLDGVDEEPDSHRRAELVQAVDELLEPAGRWRCLVTSRPHGYMRLRGDVPHHALLPFSREEIEAFVRGWHVALERRRHLAAPDLATAEAEAASLLAEIRRDSRIESLASNPLMLVVISLIRQERVRLPQQRVQLYERAVRTLMDTWNDWRTRPAANVGGAVLPYDRMVRVWGAAARWMHRERPTGIVHREKLRSVLVEVLHEQDDSADPELTADSYLNAAAQRAGLLEERGTNIFAFWHPTFQEFLAATDLVTPLSGAESKVLAVRDDSRWREVIVLAIGVVGIVRQEPETATSLVTAIMAGGVPSLLEPLLHARLRLAATCVADDTGVRRALRDNLIRRLADAVAMLPHRSLESSFVATVRRLGDHEPTPETIQALIRLTTHSRWQVRMEATRLLANVSRVSEDALKRCWLLLKDADDNVRCHAAIGLARSGDASVQVALALAGVGNPEAHIERSATAFVTSSACSIRSTLLAALADSDSSIRVGAAGALWSLGLTDERALETLIRGLADSDTSVRDIAAEALASSGSAHKWALKTLVRALADSDPSVRAGAAAALGHMGAADEPTEALVGALADSDPSVRARAAAALGPMGGADERTAEALVRALADSDPFVRRNAARALRNVGRNDKPVVAALVRALADSDGDVRAAAAEVLMGPASTDERVVEALIRALADSDGDVRAWAAQSLSPASADERVVEALVRTLTDSHPFARDRAAWALGNLARADDQTVEALIRAFADSDADVRITAARSVRRLGRADERTVEIVVRVFDDSNLSRSGAGWALASFGPLDPSAEARLIASAAPSDIQLWFVEHGTLVGLQAYLGRLSNRPVQALAACDRVLCRQSLGEADVAALLEVLARSPDDDAEAWQISGTVLGWLARRLEVDPIDRPA